MEKEAALEAKDATVKTGTARLPYTTNINIPPNPRAAAELAAVVPADASPWLCGVADPMYL